MREYGSSQKGSSAKKLLRVVVAILVAAVGLMLFLVGSPPRVTIEPAMPGIGPRTPIAVEASVGGRGLGEVRVEVVQGDLEVEVARRDHQPRPFWAFWGPRTLTDRLDVEVGYETVPELQEGEAAIRVVAARAGTPLRHPDPLVVERQLPVIVRPPSLAVTSTFHYAAQGGSEVVVYRVGPSATADGVRAGEDWFPGYALPGGGEGERFCLFAVPFDLGEASAVKLVARDAVGNELAEPFLDRFTPRPPTLGTIELSEEFMSRVVPPILAQSRGELAQAEHPRDGGSEGRYLLDDYLLINGELRRRNAERLVEIAADSRPAFLWHRAFLQLPGSQVMSPFAVRRTYRYQGKAVDEQVHLGFDLASHRRAEVPASNPGIVLMAEFFGIYGNTVVLDHGYGLMSLYAHLSRIDVSTGQQVERGEVLGRTGATGLAGGDHLHFSMLVQGVPVTPVEWWDGKWIDDHIARKLGDAMPFER